ncbi:NDR1/HIN1-like protein 10 [Camellia lanceoleosa]|uniref:NDR1/HIN1-like protein 10 n=1 Tax=Camellia lanceoleosa TaxID=1840588 RepID=A0ACC0F2J3_9ERIC|nr:NDR1/HIN1-like protein 10 [Camellia lanceoleosa]
MENHNETVMGYPPNFFPSTHGIGNRVFPQPTTTPATPTTTTTTASKRISPCVHGMVVVVVITISMSLIMLMVYLDSRSYSPKFQVTWISAPPFDISKSSSSSSSLTAHWNINFIVENPNDEASILYERVDASVLYHGVSLASTSMLPFYQNEREKTIVGASLDAMSEFIDESVAEEIGVDWMHGRLKFSVIVDGTVRLNIRNRKGEGQHMRASCQDVEVGASTDCKVHLAFFQ